MILPCCRSLDIKDWNYILWTPDRNSPASGLALYDNPTTCQDAGCISVVLSSTLVVWADPKSDADGGILDIVFGKPGDH
jgi:hypothetical protein